MAFRKIKLKKYSGILEYYNPKDKDKVTRSYYLSYRDESGSTCVKRCDAIDRDEALTILNKKKSEITDLKNRIKRGEATLERQKKNKSMTVDQYAAIFHPGRTNKDAKAERAMYYNHISPLIGKKKIVRLTRDDIIDFRKKLEKKKVKRPKVLKDSSGNKVKTIEEEISLSPKTIKSILDYLRVILNNTIDLWSRGL